MPNKNPICYIKLLIFIMGFLSALPTLLTWKCLNLWFATMGSTPSFLSSLSLMGLPYSFKILFVPFLDRYSFSSYTYAHHWQGWMGISALFLAISLTYLGLMAPYLTKTSLIIVGIIINSCAIVFQSSLFFLKIQLLTSEDLNTGIFAQRLGIRWGLYAGEASLLCMSYYLNWHYAYCFCSALFFGFGTFLLISPHMNELFHKHDHFHQPSRLSLKELYITMKRYPFILSLAFLINLGDDFISPLVNIFYLDCGFNYPTIAVIAKIWGTCCFTLGGFIATQRFTQHSLLKTLLVITLLHALSLSIFSLLQLHNNQPFFCFFIFLKNTTLGFKSIIIARFFAEFIRKSSCKGLLYTLIASAKSLALSVSFLSGYCYNFLGWNKLFALDTFLAFPGIILLFILNNQDIDLLMDLKNDRSILAK
jgi:PAT family beta-lactamase induction signal transducer AmpG